MKSNLKNLIYKNYINPVLSNFSKGKIAMFHIGRSGSTVVANLLNNHPKILWDGEIYHKLIKDLDIRNKQFLISNF